MTQLCVQVLGPLRVLDECGAEIKLASRKSRALLAYLALRPSESHARDRLATLLWEHADDELARTSLRQALASLRKALPESLQSALLTTTDTVALDGDCVQCDVTQFKSSVITPTRASLQTAAQLYRGDLLEGFDARSANFEEWLSNERLLLRRQACEALQRLAQLALASQDFDCAATACNRLLVLEPLNEANHRVLMELHAKRGAYAEALRQFRVCKDLLRRELDVAPEPATEQLYRELMKRRRMTSDGAHTDDTDVSVEEAEDDGALTRIDSRPQLRDAVVLVARLNGLLELEATLDPEESHRLATAFQDRVHRIVQEFGGAADRRVGSNVLAVFGIPNAYGNEAECAVRAALMLKESVKHEHWPVVADLDLQIGIAQGQVLPTATLFPLSGRPTHVAHTLATRAQAQEILLSDELRQSLGDRGICKHHPADDLNGAAMRTWILDSLRTQEDAAERPFVGRRPELAMVLAALDRCVAARRGRAIVVRGEAGIGKSRLVEAVTKAALDRNIEVHCAQIFDFGQSPGRGPIQTLALSLMGASVNANASERSAAVRRLLAARGGSIDQSIFLSDLVDAPLESELASLQQAMDAQTRERGRASALASIIEAAAQRSAQLLVAEDVHWADAVELARLGEIAATVASCPILLIMTTRPEGDPINAAWRARARGCPVTTLDLAPLAPDEAAELAAYFPELSRSTVDACISRAEGYPLFLDQLLRAANAGHESLPGSVRTLVLSRADRLTDLDHRALLAAAVLGQRFGLDALRHMLEEPHYEVSALTEAGLVLGSGNELQFAHALFRDAVYESTLKSQRRDWHKKAAGWFEQRDMALRADHLAAAQDEGAAAAYADAARAEQQAFKFERALGLATKAAALAHEPEMLHSTSALMGELLLLLGRTHDALAAYREALDFAVDPIGRGRGLFGIASALRVMDRHEEALDALDRAEVQLADSADARTRAQLSTLRGNLCFPLGRYDACLQAHRRAHEFAVQAGCPLETARALGGLGDAFYQRGELVTARKHFTQCVQEARKHNLANVLLANLPMLGITDVYYGSPTAGRESLKEALELAHRLGDLRSELLIHLCFGPGFLIQAQYAEAERTSNNALRLARQLGARRFQSECTGILAITHLARGERVKALELAREGLELGRETGMSYCGPVLLSILARATDDATEREQALKEGEALLAAGCVSHSYLDFYSNAIEVSLQHQQWNEALRHAAALESYTAREPMPLTDAIVRRARLLAAAGISQATPKLRQELEDLAASLRKMNAHAAIAAVEQRLASC